jgi:hypothetical protein
MAMGGRSLPVGMMRKSVENLGIGPPSVVVVDGGAQEVARCGRGPCAQSLGRWWVRGPRLEST